MIFYGYGTVWDPEHDRPLCRFKDGKYETEDPREIKLLMQVQEQQQQGKLSPDDAIKRRMFEERQSKISLDNLDNIRLSEFKIIKRF